MRAPAGSGDRLAAPAALGALVFLLLATGAWWALALWPAPGAAPEWLARARWVCFNAPPDGLPDASGWLLLIGQPLGMLAALMAIWGEPLRAGLRRLASSRGGRAALAASAALGLAGLAAAGARVADAAGRPPLALASDELPPDTYPRLDRDAPELDLVDQRGARIDLVRLAGRPALVTFAFAHCETICPAVVRQVLDTQRRARELAGDDASRVPRVVVVTLDPWRDTPSRLGWLAESWAVGDDGFVLSGGVDEVEAALDRWGVARGRDPATGEVVHPPLVYVVDAAGRIAYAAAGGAPMLLELLERTAPRG